MANSQTHIEEFRPTEEEQNIVQSANRLAGRLGKGIHLKDHFRLITALSICRSYAQRMSGNVNSVQNRGYSTAFSYWIQMHLPKVAEILQPHDIHALLHFGDPLVMEEWEAISASLTPYERSRINTPASAWNRLKREREKVKGIRPLSTAAKKKASEEELQRLQDEIATRRDFAPQALGDDVVFRDFLLAGSLTSIGGIIAQLPKTTEVRTRLFAIGEQIRTTLAAGERRPATPGDASDIVDADADMESAIQAAIDRTAPEGDEA